MNSDTKISNEHQNRIIMTHLEHKFNIDLACKYGVREAVMLDSFIYLTAYKSIKQQDMIDGRIWVYNSIAEWQKFYPYMTTSAIRTTLQNLINSGAIIKGCYNEDQRDRTSWYSLSDAFMEEFGMCVENQKCACENSQAHLSKSASSFAKIDEPLPLYNNSTNYSNNNSNKERIFSDENIQKKGQSKTKSVDETFDLSFVDWRLLDAFKGWLEYKKERKQSYKTQKSVEICYKHLLEANDLDIERSRKAIEQSIANNYQGLFTFKGDNYGNTTGNSASNGNINGGSFRRGYAQNQGTMFSDLQKQLDGSF